MLMRVNAFLIIEVVAECLGKGLRFWSNRVHGGPGHRILYHIDILQYCRFWRGYGGQLSYEAHRV